MESWERVQFIMDKEGLNKNSFSKAIGITNNVTITRIINENRSASRATCEKIVSTFPKYNLNWLLTGEGEMLNNSPQTQTTKDEAVLFEFGTIMNVPLVNQYAYAGYLCGYSDPEYIGALPTIPFPVDREYQGQYICFEVKGDSMDDGSKYSFEEGDIVLCRDIAQEYWKSKLHINKWNAFVIVHKTDGVLIKKIIDHDVEKGIITIHSLNALYKDRELNLADVKMLFNVVKMQRNQ